MTTAVPIDWDLAARVGSRLIPAGPAVTPGAAAAAVAELRDCAERAQPLVRELTGWDAPAAPAPVLVIDRKSWVRANVGSFRALLGEDRESGAVQRAATGIELGGLLAWFGTKVLGQFDPFGTETGRLLLIAPNIVQAERQLRVHPGDFRLWVCLHEETHRLQFTANPWLREHLRAETTALVDGLDLATPETGELLRRLTGKLGRVSLLDLLGRDGADSRAVVERITAVMSLLEGHADVVMDQVGPSVIGSVQQIRQRFEQRRSGRGPDRLLRRLLGMDRKLAQYRDGARFCRAVLDRAGTGALSRAYASPGNLPSLTEIHDPDSWLRRQGLTAPLERHRI